MMPRLMITAPASGSGKTTLTCALLRAFQRRGLRLAAYKSGPDYIDPMFHKQVLGIDSDNLDGFFFDREGLCGLLGQRSRDCDLSLLEGAMGYYDGIGLGDRASAWALGRATGTPAVLVVDGKGAALSLAATIRGFQALRQDSGLVGVLLNRVSPMLYPRLSAALEQETGLPVLGYLPGMEEAVFASRHLGLVTAEEIPLLQEKLDRLAEMAEKTIQLDKLLQLAQGATELPAHSFAVERVTKKSPRIAVARDRAFCFYYPRALALLQGLGAESVEFSPLRDRQLPRGTAGLYLGGGYPELYARELSENSELRGELCRKIQLGLPTVAECGGFLYLQQELTDSAGEVWPMVGVLPGRGYPTDRLSRFGYITLRAEKDGLLFKKGEEIPAHEFHYWDSTQPGGDFFAQKPGSDRHWRAGVQSDSLYAGFPHFHFCSGLEQAKRFVLACEKRAEQCSE